MRIIGLLLGSLFLFTACANHPLPMVPVMRAPMPALLVPVNANQGFSQGFRTSMNGLLGEEVELTGIYNSDRAGARLLLRSGEELSLRDAAGVPLALVPGIENRSQVRIRGRVTASAGSALLPYSLEIRQAVRIA